MNAYTTYQAHNELIRFTDSLIRENKKVTLDGYNLTVDDLSESDLEEFAAHLIEYASVHREGWHWLLEDPYQEEIAGTFTDYLLAWSKSKREALQTAFLESLKQSAIKTYKNRMQKMIDDRLGTVEAEDREEAKHPSDADDDYYYERGTA